MTDIKKLPKWAQDRIEAAERNQNTKNVGAEITGCHVENNAVRHDKHSAKAIAAVAEAMGKNADAMKELAKSLSGTGVEVQFGHGINLSHVNPPK